MKAERPVNLQLTTIALPLSALTSFLHRVTGILLFVGSAFLVWFLHQSLGSPAGFAYATSVASHWFAKLIIWGLLAVLSYHLTAGIKHLLMDRGIGETKEGGHLASQITLGITAVLIVLTGIWVW